MTVSAANNNLDCAQADLAAEEANLIKAHASVDSKVCAAKALEEEVQFSMSKVDLFPEHVFDKLPLPPQDTLSPVSDSSSTRACPHCNRFFIANAYMPLSYGCQYHPACLRDMILRRSIWQPINCLQYGIPPQGAWMAS
jgi:hypothetical protein